MLQKKAQRIKPTDADLQVWSGEHLAYTLTLFKGIVERLSFKPDWIVEMALLETFTVECRNLLEFFYASEPTNPKRFDDAIAIDFFATATSWESIRQPLLTPALENAKKRISKETTHLTYSRISGTPPEKLWDLEKIYNDMAEVVRIFIANANPNTLHQTIKVFELRLFKR